MNDLVPLVALLVWVPLLLVGLPLLAWVGQRNRGRKESFEAVCAAFGLSVEGDATGGFTATGAVDGNAVRFWQSEEGLLGVEVRTGERASVEGRNPLGGGTGVGTGDRAFDRLVVIDGGEPGDTRALASSLDADARRAVAAMVRLGAGHAFGLWTLQTSTSLTDAGTVLRGMLAAAAALQGDRGRERLRAQSQNDPVPEVRALAGERLVAALEGAGPTDADLLAALEQELPTPRARLRVARLRGDAGLPTIRTHLAHPDPSVAVEAALALAAVAPGPEVEPALLAALGAADPRVVEALYRWGTVAAVLPLRAWADRHPEHRSLVTTTIERIQGRAIGAAAGQVSMAADDAVGRISSASRDTGRLAAREPPP